MIPANPVPRRGFSPLEAAQQAIELTGKRLFPFNLQRWLALGFVAFLDTCGQGGGGGGGGMPGTPGSPGGGDFGSDGPDFGGSAREWLSSHLALIIGISLAVLVFVVLLMALVTFLRSRGVFMYIDDVATGRFDVKRPWREHAEKANSYFLLSFGVTLASMLVFLVLLVPITFAVLSLVEHGAQALPIIGIVVTALVIVVLAIALGLFGVLLRDFAAPLQMLTGSSTGSALGLAWSLVKQNLGSFVVYVLLKLVVGMITALAALFAGCITCCLGFLPVISHTILQPFHYFSRAWSMFMLRQAGYDLFPPPPPAAPPADYPPPVYPPSGYPPADPPPPSAAPSW